jgi:segregation and condensation protein A
MIEALENAPQERSFERDVSIPRVRVRDKIISIVRALRKSGSLSFKRVVMGAHSKLEVIVSFLAVLELIKQDQIIAEQDGLFNDIVLTPSANWDEVQAAEFELEFEE